VSECNSCSPWRARMWELFKRVVVAALACAVIIALAGEEKP
jgi:hypothetical protein